MTDLDRRELLRRSAAGGLIIGFAGLSSSCKSTKDIEIASEGRVKTLYLEVTPENRFLLTFDKVEMGQGAMTGQATMFGEEADIHPTAFILKPATADPRYADGGIQITAGSSSTYSRWEKLRVAGASYRNAVVQAASRKWGVKPTQIRTNEGMVFTASGDHKAAYAAFNADLREEDFIKAPPLKDRKDFRYIGKFSDSLDAADKSLAKAEYGIDVRIPGRKVAIVIRCPVHGGKLKGFDAKAIKGLKHVHDVCEVSAGVAIICDHYYQTLKVRQELQEAWIRWDIPDEYRYDSDKLFTTYKDLLEEDELKAGTGEKAIAATYEVPYLAHAPLEPQNCTVWRKKDSIEMWVPTQSPTLAKNAAALLSDLPRDQVILHVTKYMGGGFGRRTTDSVIDAIEIANQVSYPVQLIWSREDDMKFSAMRPMAVARMQAVFKDNQVKEWNYETVSQSMMQELLHRSGSYAMPAWIPGFLGKGLTKAAAGTMNLFDVVPIAKEGAEQPYDLPYDINTVQFETQLPAFFWRSVGSSINGFVVESFVDELAHEMQMDPLSLRLRLLAKNAEAQAVVKRVAEIVDWDNKKPTKTRALGLAYHFSYRTHCAQVADVEIKDGRLKVHSITTAVNCGTVVNPHNVEAQVRSAVMFGLTAALKGEITFKDGQAQQSNFDSYPILKLADTPKVDVFTMPSTKTPTGIGEPGLPAVAATLCNAIYRISGKRYRKLPLEKYLQV